MTDILERREEVMETTAIEALTLPVNKNVVANVQRFGFEYEMLPRSMRNRGYMTGSESEPEYCDGDWYDDVNDCGCPYCAPEGGSNSPGDSGDLITRFHRANLIASTDQHDYHCDCSTCDYEREDPLMVAQTDSTVAVEFVSRIIDLRDDDFREDVKRLVRVMERWKDDGHWMPDGYEDCGNHVHVSHQGDDDFWGSRRDSMSLARRVERNIKAIFAVFDWNQVADGGCGRIRSYNTKPRKDNGYGSWLSLRENTFEHRLWNTPHDPQRLWAHLGLSVALTRWGFAIAQHDEHFDFWESSGYHDSPRMGDAMYDTIAHNITAVVRGIRDYIPQGSEFNIARDLIGNLRSM